MSVLRGLDSSCKFSATFGDDFGDHVPVCSPAQQVPSGKGSTLKGKNLLPEQILSF